MRTISISGTTLELTEQASAGPCDKDYARLDGGPGQMLDRFLPSREVGLASAAH